ncbi:hypothetical protein QJQ45_012460 [Haematococcus lacustris]|nr:hypothetical protein QJQ45_012460 [Haematococcus lacustris]
MARATPASASSRMLGVLALGLLVLAAAQPDPRSFVPSATTCPFRSTVTSPNQFAAAQWCRLAEGGANTALTTASGTPAVQSWGTRNWGHPYGGPDGSGGPYSYRRFPLSQGGVCTSASSCPIDNAGANTLSDPGGLGCSADGPTGVTAPSYWASPACTSNSFGASSTNPTQCNPADSWGSVSTQCKIPGAGWPSYPWTLPLTTACDNVVITLDLVDKTPSPAPNVPNFAYHKASGVLASLGTSVAAAVMAVGVIYIFKDYSDILYFTVSLNATWRPNRGVTQTTLPPLFFNSLFVGQYLHAQPRADFNATGQGPPVGSLLVWDVLNAPQNPTQYPQYINMLAADSLSGFDRRLWSCFTYQVDLKSVCNPTTAEYRSVDYSGSQPRILEQGPGCYPRAAPTNLTKLTAAPFVRDLSSAPSLVVQPLFTVTKFSLSPGCQPSDYTAVNVPTALAQSNTRSGTVSNINTTNVIGSTSMTLVSTACGCADVNTVSPTSFALSSGSASPTNLAAFPAANPIPNIGSSYDNNLHVNTDPASNGYWPASTITIGLTSQSSLVDLVTLGLPQSCSSRGLFRPPVPPPPPTPPSPSPSPAPPSPSPPPPSPSPPPPSPPPPSPSPSPPTPPSPPSLSTYSAWYFNVSGTILTQAHCRAIDTFLAPFLVGRTNNPTQYCTLYSNQDPVTGVLRTSVLLKAIAFGLPQDRDFMFSLFGQTTPGVALTTPINAVSNNWVGLLSAMGIDRAGATPACNLFALYYQGGIVSTPFSTDFTTLTPSTPFYQPPYFTVAYNGFNTTASAFPFQPALAQLPFAPQIVFPTGSTGSLVDVPFPAGIPVVLVLNNTNAPIRSCAVSVSVTRASTTPLGSDLASLIATLTTLYTSLQPPYPYALLPAPTITFTPYPPNTNTTFTAVLALSNRTQLAPWYSYVTSNPNLVSIVASTRTPPLSCADTITFSDLIQVDLDANRFLIDDIPSALNFNSISNTVYSLFRLQQLDAAILPRNEPASVVTSANAPFGAVYGSITETVVNSLPAISTMVNNTNATMPFFVVTAGIPCGSVVTVSGTPGVDPVKPPPTAGPAPHEFYISTSITAHPPLQSGDNQAGTMQLVKENLCNRFQLQVQTALLRLQPPPRVDQAYVLPSGQAAYNGCGVINILVPPGLTRGVRVYLKAFLNVTAAQMSALHSAGSYMLSDAFINGTNTFCGSAYVFRGPNNGNVLASFNSTTLPGLNARGVCATALP